MGKEEIGERMVRMETKMEEHCKSNDERFDRIEVLLNGFIKSADRKFASKLTEKIVYGMAGIILTSVLYIILKSVGIK